jgi:hypothetical protein
MTVMPRDPAGLESGLEWHADRHDWHLPELPSRTSGPAQLLAHWLVRIPVPPENVEQVLAAAKACLRDAERSYGQARAEREAIEAATRDLAAQQAAVEAAAREATKLRRLALREFELARLKAARAQATIENTRASAANTAGPTQTARPRTRPRRLRAAVLDIPGENLRPDPAAAQNPAELIEALGRFRVWAGNPSYRDMAARSGQRIGVSTMWRALRGRELPLRLEVIDAIVEGCGGSEEDRQRFATAWRRLTMGTSTAEASPLLLHAEPLPRASPIAETSAGFPQSATEDA